MTETERMQTIRSVVDQIRKRLPSGWRVEADSDSMVFTAPDGTEAKVQLIVRKSLTPRDAKAIIYDIEHGVPVR